MPLPASGAIGLAECGNHLGIATSSAVSMNTTAFRNMANVATPNATISMTSLHGKGIQASTDTFETTNADVSRLDVAFNGGNFALITLGNNESAAHTHSWFLTTPTTGGGHEVFCEVLSGAVVSGTGGEWLPINIGASVHSWICTPASGSASLKLHFRNATTTQQARGTYNLIIA